MKDELLGVTGQIQPTRGGRVTRRAAGARDPG